MIEFAAYACCRCGSGLSRIGPGGDWSCSMPGAPLPPNVGPDAGIPVNEYRHTHGVPTLDVEPERGDVTTRRDRVTDG